MTTDMSVGCLAHAVTVASRQIKRVLVNLLLPPSPRTLMLTHHFFQLHRCFRECECITEFIGRQPEQPVTGQLHQRKLT
jgi:hypothetical protein